MRYSDHFSQGKALFDVAKQKGLEGILAKRRNSVTKSAALASGSRSRLRRLSTASSAATPIPKAPVQDFGSIVLGLYDKQGELIHVGQAGTGFDQAMLKEVWQALKKLETKRSPFPNGVEALRTVHWVKPELVAEIKFTEWTHESTEGGMKLRAPVFLRLREDKDPKECVLAVQLLPETVSSLLVSGSKPKLETKLESETILCLSSASLNRSLFPRVPRRERRFLQRHRDAPDISPAALS